MSLLMQSLSGDFPKILKDFARIKKFIFEDYTIKMKDSATTHSAP